MKKKNTENCEAIVTRGQFSENPALPSYFYNRNTIQVARDLLGTLLLCESGGILTGGYIVETEAYLGQEDPASHAARRKTPRNSVMFGPRGRVYVYFIYGMYYCFNVVAYDPSFQPAGAVLVRALQPAVGIDEMQKRRNKKKIRDIANGPGKLCQALAITKDDNNSPLNKGKLRLTANNDLGNFQIISDRRIGISEGIVLPYRFYIADNEYVSRTGKK